MDNLELNGRLRDLGAERQRVQEQIEELQKAETKQANQSARLRELADWLEKQPKELTEYDDAVTRRLVEKITVVDADTIRVRIRDSAAEIETRLPAQ
jgi:seryl-tRNA synthetase